MKFSKKSNTEISGSLKYWLRDYLENSSIAGCRYYFSPETSPRKRIFWLVVHVTSVSLMVTLALDCTIDYAATPTVTTIENGNLDVQEVDFPGVAICNVNKISYKEVTEVAHEIMEYNYGGNYTRDEIIDALKYLGHLYLFELDDEEEEVIEILHKVLLSRYGEYVPTLLQRLSNFPVSWDVTEYLVRTVLPFDGAADDNGQRNKMAAELATPCEYILEYCRWEGRQQSCDDMFSTRKTADGYCCTFNYVRPSDDFGGDQKEDGISFSGGVERVGAPGARFGLTVLLRPDLGDHHYKILPSLGYKISIFSSMDYPDAPSGTLREIFVSPKTVALIAVQATSFYSVQDVARYDVNDRDCLFSDELNARFQGYYSYSDCIMYCRITDIERLCQCIPFFYPTINKKQVRTCNLKDLRCLKEFKHRWWSVTPRFEERMTPFNDSRGSLNCSECFPACADVAYQVSVTTAPFKPWETFVTSFGGSMKMDNHSLVKIFFRGTGSVRLRQDVMFYWYELMSNYGGICGFFLGISLISVIEFLYFFTLRLYKRKDDELEGKNSRFTFVKAAKPSLRPLYWHEMMKPAVY